MPELPEVETVRNGLAPVMEEARFVRVELRRDGLRFPFPERFVERLIGWRVSHIDRRAKYLLCHLTSGETLIIHLGMTGRFIVENRDEAGKPGQFHYTLNSIPAHDHVVFHMDHPGGFAKVTYNDVRRFGFMDIVETDQLDVSPHFAGIGPEPLGNGFSEIELAAAFKARNTSVKQALLDQRVVAGLGNIYVCEALYRAGISPRRKAKSVGPARLQRLVPAIRTVLTEAIDAGGSTLKDYAATDGALGYFQHSFNVYDREGQACAKCDGNIQRIVQSGRSTFFCSSCQR